MVCYVAQSLPLAKGSTYDSFRFVLFRFKVEKRRRARGPEAKVKMLILMSDTGGGHRASAQALEAALEELFPERVEVTIVDIITEHSHWPYNASVPAYQVGRERRICVQYCNYIVVNLLF